MCRALCEHGMSYLWKWHALFVTMICPICEHGMPFVWTWYALFPATILSLISSSLELSVFTVDPKYALGFNVLKLELKKVAGQRPGAILQKITISYTSLLIIDLIFNARHGIVYFIYSYICMF